MTDRNKSRDYNKYRDAEMAVKIYVNTSIPGKIFVDVNNEANKTKEVLEFKASPQDLDKILSIVNNAFKPLVMYEALFDLIKEVTRDIDFEETINNSINKDKDKLPDFNLEEFLKDLKKDLDKD